MSSSATATARAPASSQHAIPKPLADPLTSRSAVHYLTQERSVICVQTAGVAESGRTRGGERLRDRHSIWPSFAMELPLIASPPRFPLIRAPIYFHINPDVATHKAVAPLLQAIHRCDLEAAWTLFQEFAREPNGLERIHTGRLHGLMNLLVNAPNTTRRNYTRMLEVVGELRRRGLGKVREWEWNALMSAAAKGFRRTTMEDYQAALAVYRDWGKYLEQGQVWRASLTAQGSRWTVGDAWCPGEQWRQLPSSQFTPSVWTFNALLSIASKTGDPRAFEDAQDRFARSSFRPNDITHLIMINHHGMTGRTDLIPRVLETMIQERMPIGAHGAHTVAWAYARQGHLSVARDVYDLLLRNLRFRHRPSDSHSLDPDAFDPRWNTDNPLSTVLGFSQSLEGVEPDYRMYIMMIQSYAYQGCLLPAVEILEHFLDYLSRRQQRDGDLGPETDTQIMAAFRALFVSFVKYGEPPRSLDDARSRFAGMSLKDAVSLALRDQFRSSSTLLDEDSSSSPNSYTLETLMFIFRSYITLASSLISDSKQPPALPPSQLVRAILLAFRNTAESPQEVMQYAWSTLLRQRLRPCGHRWEQVKDEWRWTKLRKDFRLRDGWDRVG